MPTAAPNATQSEQVFRSADKTTQAIIRDLLNAERNVMHMKRRDEIHVNLVQIIKKHVTKT